MSNIGLKDPIKFIVAKVKECVEEACSTVRKSYEDNAYVVDKGRDRLIERIVELVEAKLRDELNVE